MNYEDFENKQLNRFRKYYKECYNMKQRNELKNSLFNNPNLNENHKKLLWKKIKEGKR